jgi:hypothetical protein
MSGAVMNDLGGTVGNLVARWMNRKGGKEIHWGRGGGGWWG